MIRDICKDETFLAQKAEPATPEDLPAAADLLETLTHHSAGCVGMAANMIGTKSIVFVCLLAVFLEESFLIDVALIYAMLSFLAVVVLSKIIVLRERVARERKIEKIKLEKLKIVDRSHEEELRKGENDAHF